MSPTALVTSCVRRHRRAPLHVPAVPGMPFLHGVLPAASQLERLIPGMGRGWQQLGSPRPRSSSAPRFGGLRVELVVGPFLFCQENPFPHGKSSSARKNLFRKANPKESILCAAGLAVPEPGAQRLWSKTSISDFPFAGTSPWGPALAAPVLCPLPPRRTRTGADPAGGWEPPVGCAAPKRGTCAGHARVPLLAARKNPSPLEGGRGGRLPCRGRSGQMDAEAVPAFLAGAEPQHGSGEQGSARMQKKKISVKA